MCGLLAGLLVTQMAGAQVCDRRDTSGVRSDASRDLYCLTLIAVPGESAAVAGHVDLSRVPGPFTVAVTADGRAVYDPVVTVAGLPAPASLGNFTVFVAWVTPPTMYPAIKLGVVSNGSTTVRRFALDPFVMLVTAEPNANVTEPGTRVVLRAGSPSTRLLPPDMLQFAAGAVRDTGASGSSMAMPGMPAAGTPAGGTPAADADSAEGWTGVPMPAGLAMVPGEMVLRPGTAPLLPDGRLDAPDARPNSVVRVAGGDTLHLTAGLVTRVIDGRRVRMYAYNGQYPGPVIAVRRGATIVVDLTNHLDQPTTIHWHGVRLDAPFDGVPDTAHPAVPPGGRFAYRVHFPDAGVYWYHPHVREDMQQNLGLAGAIVVSDTVGGGAGPGGAAGGRTETVVLSDLLLGDRGLVPFGRTATTHALMGRFGNVFLVNGQVRPGFAARRGEVVRFRFINAANARTFNLSVPGARMKLIGSDAGAFEHEEWVESVVIGPAEQYLVDVQFRRPGRFVLANRVRALDHFFNRFFFQTDTLATVRVRDAAPGPGAAERAVRFEMARTDVAATSDIEQYRRYFSGPPGHTLELTMESHGLPFVTRMLMQLDSSYFAPAEWSGTMPGMNWAATTNEVRWVLRDPDTGRENMDIGWSFARGSVVKLRIVNQRHAFHAMQHPIHVHGQRFLVIAVNGVPARNLAWKDTVLVPAGGTVDILMDLSNPGRWMLHCHIAEHLAAQMMTEFTVQ
jgi:FtsP/CotA-like multicopper oxidase with cupredoxin domain